MNITALIPAFCEERFIADVVTRTIAQNLRRVLVVDDGSKDATAERARAAGAEVIVHSQNQGKGTALQTGLRSVLENDPESQYVLVLDADGQHLPEEIPSFVEAAAYGAKILVGSRMQDTRQMPWVRRLTNKIMSSEISRLCGQPIADTQCGFRMIHRDLIPLLLGRSPGFAYETEMLILASWRGERIVNVPVSTVYGEEVSSIHPVRDTMRFVKLMARYWAKRVRTGVADFRPLSPAGAR